LGSMLGMPLPPVGTSELLRVLSPHIPDQFINERFVRQRREGRRLRFSAAQLWRVHLLALLTRTFSFNALIRCLPEQEQWRRFAHLPNRFAVPDVRMLKDFRRALGAGVFVRSTTICFGNFWSTRPSMKEPWPSWTRRTYRPAPRIKKTDRKLVGAPGHIGSALAPPGQNPLLRRLQKTYSAALDQRPHPGDHVCATGFLGDARARARGLFA